jgi:RecA/RadA recombinase
MANKWMAKLAQHDAARQWDYNPFAHILRFSSPAMNWLFGNTHGLPKGLPMVIYGPEHSGKTLFCYDLIAQMHADDPEGIAIRFDTEMRDDAQLTPQRAELYGIDLERYQPYMTNDPEEIFDFIEMKVKGWLEDGMPLRMVIIDSITNVMGRRMAASEGIGKAQVGDDSRTQQDGLKRIQRLMNKYRIALILTSQVRAEMDPIEVMRGNTYKMAGGWFLKHLNGYVLQVEPNKGKTGRESLTGQKFEDEKLKDALGHADRTGHKIRARMRGNSFGPKNRMVEVTFDYNRGFINRHEEIFQLATERGLVERPTNVKYVVDAFPTAKDKTTYNGKDNFLKAIAENDDLQKHLVGKLKAQDLDLMEKGANSAYFRAEETKQDDLGDE